MKVSTYLSSSRTEASLVVDSQNHYIVTGKERLSRTILMLKQGFCSSSFGFSSGYIVGSWLADCAAQVHTHTWCICCFDVGNCMDQSSVFWFKARPCFNWFRILRPHLQISRRVSARQARLSYNERHGRATITSSPAMNYPYFQNTVYNVDRLWAGASDLPTNQHCGIRNLSHWWSGRMIPDLVSEYMNIEQHITSYNIIYIYNIN